MASGASASASSTLTDVVAPDLDLHAQFADIVNQVVGEAIVIID